MEDWGWETEASGGWWEWLGRGVMEFGNDFTMTRSFSELLIPFRHV
jgi:hypothetical protein